MSWPRILWSLPPKWGHRELHYVRLPARGPCRPVIGERAWAKSRTVVLQTARARPAILPPTQSHIVLWIGDQDSPARRLIGGPGVEQLEEMPGVRRLALHARMRQSLPHNQPLCVGAHQRPVEWPGIAVIRGPPAQAVNARHLDPAFAVGEVTQQALKTRGPGAGGRISATRMVDHERQFDLPRRGMVSGRSLTSIQSCRCRPREPTYPTHPGGSGVPNAP